MNRKKLQAGHSRPTRRKNFLPMKVAPLEDGSVVFTNSLKCRFLGPTPRGCLGGPVPQLILHRRQHFKIYKMCPAGMAQ